MLPLVCVCNLEPKGLAEAKKLDDKFVESLAEMEKETQSMAEHKSEN